MCVAVFSGWELWEACFVVDGGLGVVEGCVDYDWAEFCCEFLMGFVLLCPVLWDCFYVWWTAVCEDWVGVDQDWGEEWVEVLEEGPSPWLVYGVEGVVAYLFLECTYGCYA